MRLDKIVLNNLMGIGGRALKRFNALVPCAGNCAVIVMSAPAGAGMSTLLRQFATIQCRTVVDVGPAADFRSLKADIATAVFGSEEEGFWRGYQTNGQLRRELLDQGSPMLIFDHGDRIASGRLLDLVVDLGDRTGATVLLACGSGRRGLRDMLKRPQSALVESIAARVAEFVELPAPSLADARLLAAELGEVEFDPLVVEHLYQKSAASVRALLRAFGAVEGLALEGGVDRITVANFCELTGEQIDVERPIAPPRKAIESSAEVVRREIIKRASRAA